MNTRSLITAGLALAAIPALASALIDETKGTLQGIGDTPTHDFPVNATEFDIEISEADQEGFRNIEVKVPVMAIDTENSGRNSHMRGTIFEGFEEKGKELVVYRARTSTALAPGELVLDGALFILGEAKPVTVNATISGSGDDLSATGTAIVDLDDWGISTPGFGPMKVRSEINMSFTVELPPES